MTALQVIIKEAKAIRKKSPKMEWKKAVAQASAIYASKHKGVSPVGKKKAAPKKKKVGALPIGFKGSIWGVKFKIVNQFDIYNDVSAIMEDIEDGKIIVVFDGKGSANDKADKIVSYMSMFGNIGYVKDEDKRLLKSRMLKFATNMQKEVKEFNSGKKKTIKKQPLNIVAPKVKKIAQKKSAPKKAVKKHHTHWGTVHTHERRVNGVRKKKISEQSILNKIHRVKEDVNKLDEAQHKHMLGRLTKIMGSVSGKYYINYTTDSGYKKMEFFNKLPKGYYKGMDRIIYVTRLTNHGTSLIPVKLSNNDKDVKK